MTAPCITRIDAVMRTVPSIEAAVRFYGAALDVEPVGPATALTAKERNLLGLDAAQVRLLLTRLGRQQIWFIEIAPEGRPYPADSTSSDLWFQHCALVVGDVAAACAQATGAGAMPISEGGPQTLPPNTGGVTAFKFRDPFGHPLELLGFPAGVGAPVWHAADRSLFHGIDHTAIAVSDGERSRRFYADVLGMSVSDVTRNRGVEQSRLDAVAADDVDVVALEPVRSPPHLELLAYRTGTRRALSPVSPADIAVTRTIATGDMAAIVEHLRAVAHPFWLGTFQDSAAVTFADPDGHAWICRAE